jgi:hypothetical protein
MADALAVFGDVAPQASRGFSFFVKGSRRYELEKAFAGAGLAETSHA